MHMTLDQTMYKQIMVKTCRAGSGDNWKDKTPLRELDIFPIRKILYYRFITSLKNKNDRMKIYLVLFYCSPVRGVDLSCISSLFY